MIQSKNRSRPCRFSWLLIGALLLAVSIDAYGAIPVKSRIKMIGRDGKAVVDQSASNSLNSAPKDAIELHNKVTGKVEYAKEANSLRYASHREIADNERMIIEQYILTNFATKTDYFRRHPALFIYLGKDEKLVRDLNMFHLKNTLKDLASREQEVKEQVDALINSSMSKYYFERIGETILEFRRNLKYEKNAMDPAKSFTNLKETKHKMDELVRAYNIYSDKKISLKNIVPNDLQEFFEYN